MAKKKKKNLFQWMVNFLNFITSLQRKYEEGGVRASLWPHDRPFLLENLGGNRNFNVFVLCEVSLSLTTLRVTFVQFLDVIIKT